MLNFNELYEFVLKKWDEKEALEIVQTIENALDRGDQAKRVAMPLCDRFIEVKKRMDKETIYQR